MKKVYLFSLLCLLACEKDTLSVDRLVGKWQISENMFGENVEAVFEKSYGDKTIEFFEDGTVQSNGSLCFNDVVDSGSLDTGTYSLTTNLISSSCNFVAGAAEFSLETDDEGLEVLQISYDCSLVCRQRFRKVN